MGKSIFWYTVSGFTFESLINKMQVTERINATGINRNLLAHPRREPLNQRSLLRRNALPATRSPDRAAEQDQEPHEPSTRERGATTTSAAFLGARRARRHGTAGRTRRTEGREGLRSDTECSPEAVAIAPLLAPSPRRRPPLPFFLLTPLPSGRGCC